MNFLKNCFKGSVIAALLMALTLPVNAASHLSDNSCCVQPSTECCQFNMACPQDMCCEMPCKKGKRSALSGPMGWALGAIALGAAAGAGAGYAAGNNNKNCHSYKSYGCGSKSSSTPCLCERDHGQTLCFNFKLLLDALVPGIIQAGGIGALEEDLSLSITPFVVGPDGCCYTGKTAIKEFCEEQLFEVEFFFTANCFENCIVVCDPVYGTYHAGVELVLNHTFAKTVLCDPEIFALQLGALNAALLQVNVCSSRDNTETTLPIPLEGSLFNKACVDRTQVTQEFNYCPKIPGNVEFPQPVVLKQPIMIQETRGTGR